MSQYLPGSKLVFASLGYAADGPYLQVNDVDEKIQLQLPVLGRTFTIRFLEQRYCVGSFDLSTYESAACELGVDLPPVGICKDDMCPKCRELTGFNPMFYNVDSISPQQRAYNQTPHFVYMAYFSPEHFKVGISSETRGIERLLEQGALVAAVLKRFPNADEARALEAHLCAQEGILETMRLQTKVKLLSEHFDPNSAIDLVRQKAESYGVSPEGKILDLTPFYFGKVSKRPLLQQVPAGEPVDIAAGRCVGMVGGTLCMEQNGSVFCVPVKEFESHQVEIFIDEIQHEYDFVEAMSLF